MKLPIEANYPNITLWVKDRGTIEIGHDPNTDSFIRATDEGGIVWSGKNRYENLDAACQDLEVALGQVLVDRVGGVEPPVARNDSQKRSIPKENQVRSRKGPPEDPRIKQVNKLDAIIEAIRSKENVQVTRLTVVKKLCEKPEAAGAFAMFLAQQARGRLRENPGQARYSQLADRAVGEIKSFLDDPTEVHARRLQPLLSEIQAEQDEYVSIQWSAVRNIKSWDLLIVENALRSILHREDAARWLYQAARDSVGGSCEFQKKAIPRIEEIAQFWRQYLTVKG